MEFKKVIRWSSKYQVWKTGRHQGNSERGTNRKRSHGLAEAICSGHHGCSSLLWQQSSGWILTMPRRCLTRSTFQILSLAGLQSHACILAAKRHGIMLTLLLLMLEKNVPRLHVLGSFLV